MFKAKSLEHFFKPEVRMRGEEYYDEDAVYLSTATDTKIAGVIKATPPVRITLTSSSISDPTFTAACSCTSSLKGQLCKHIWGTILTAALDYPDFFDSKTDLVKEDAESSATPKKREISASQKEFQDKLKVKQSENRKQQYQKLKSEKKSKKNANAASAKRPTYNDAAENAIRYFAENGFELGHPINVEALRSAKKILSRVFHPDKGGSHEEVLALNQNFDILIALQENR